MEWENFWQTQRQLSNAFFFFRVDQWCLFLHTTQMRFFIFSNLPRHWTRNFRNATHAAWYVVQLDILQRWQGTVSAPFRTRKYVYCTLSQNDTHTHTHTHFPSSTKQASTSVKCSITTGDKMWKACRTSHIKNKDHCGMHSTGFKKKKKKESLAERERGVMARDIATCARI